MANFRNFRNNKQDFTAQNEKVYQDNMGTIKSTAKCLLSVNNVAKARELGFKFIVRKDIAAESGNIYLKLAMVDVNNNNNVFDVEIGTITFGEIKMCLVNLNRDNAAAKLFDARVAGSKAKFHLADLIRYNADHYMSAFNEEEQNFDEEVEMA